MANVDDAYCATGDLRTGDLATPSYTTKEQYVKNAAEEIDTALGHIYVTPFVIDPDGDPKFRPTILFLKKVNWLLASGRFILDIAAAGEQDSLHSYGKRMLDEAMGMLEKVLAGDVPMTGAEKLEGTGDENSSRGPQIQNEDPESLVEVFYRQRQTGPLLGESYPIGGHYPQAVPYGRP